MFSTAAVEADEVRGQRYLSNTSLLCVYTELKTETSRSEAEPMQQRFNHETRSKVETETTLSGSGVFILLPLRKFTEKLPVTFGKNYFQLFSELKEICKRLLIMSNFS